MNKKVFSHNSKINNLLDNILNALAPFLEEQDRNINELSAIGLALSAEQDIEAILEMILAQARRFTRADGGTIYLLNKPATELVFHVVESDSLQMKMGGRSGKPVSLPPVPLFTADNKKNLSNVSAYVANTGQTVNIPDVYQAKGFNFDGTKRFDASINYRSCSMLVMPMKDHEGDIIGVLQLINSLDNRTGKPVPFGEDIVQLASALASQAAVALTQQFLINELKELFESFIHAIATAIDKKSKYTGGHIQRVAELTMMIADKINAATDGPFKDVQLSRDQLNELRIAAWLHDTGKITTPEYVVDKSNKLETIFDRIELVKLRWELFRLKIKLDAEKEKNRILTTNGQQQPNAVSEIDARCEQALQTLDADLDFITQTNKGGEFMSDAALNRLQQLAQQTCLINGLPQIYLTEDELDNLSVRKGTLTDAERETINSHALATVEILSELPWPKKLANVPDIAGAHHEKLDGSGYPRGLKGDSINLQARIMAVADVFEALSASDRPYKKSMTLAQVNKVLGFMVRDNHVDADIVELLINSGIQKIYADRFLNPEQIQE